MLSRRKPLLLVPGRRGRRPLRIRILFGKQRSTQQEFSLGNGYAPFLSMTVGDDAHGVPFSVKDETILHHTPCGRLTPPPKKPALRRLFLIRFQCFPFISPLLLPPGKAKKGAKQSQPLRRQEHKERPQHGDLRKGNLGRQVRGIRPIKILPQVQRGHPCGHGGVRCVDMAEV